MVVSVLNKDLSLVIEDVPSFKDSADRKFEMLLKVLYNVAGPGTSCCHYFCISNCS